MNADNLTILNGNLTRDVDLSYANSGTAIAKFTVATNRSRKEKDGSRKSDFHSCIAFGKTGEIIAQYFRKGTMIGIVGEYQDNNYTKQDGTKVYAKQVVVESFGFREKAGKSTSSSQDFSRNKSPFGGSSTIDINDGDLPF